MKKKLLCSWIGINVLASTITYLPIYATEDIKTIPATQEKDAGSDTSKSSEKAVDNTSDKAKEEGEQTPVEQAIKELENDSYEEVMPEEERSVIEIRSEEDFYAFQKECQVNGWSTDKKVVLLNDIQLTQDVDAVIPVFGGLFDGQNHTISGIKMMGSGYADGLFRYVENVGTIRNLKVQGTIENSDEKVCTGGICGINAGWIQSCSFDGMVNGKCETGGICGENEHSGIISNCEMNGVIIGYDRAGGIAGANYGTIRNCTNHAYINADNRWLEDEDEGGYEWIIRDVKEKKLISGTDIGGIAGYSTGCVMQCTNESTVGYDHNGYNIGGIVGRQAGQVLYCVNHGEVFGRKDVGGIVGQMEPNISVEEAKSLSEAVNELHDQVDVFLRDAGKTSDHFSADFDSLRGASDEAVDHVDTITGEVDKFVNENVKSVNEIANRLDYLADQMPDILGETRNSIATLNDCAGDLRRVVSALDYTKLVEDTPYNETKFDRLSKATSVGGDVYFSETNPEAGTEVTVTISPDTNYALDSLHIKDGNGNEVDYSMTEDRTECKFIMPSANAVVEATFIYVGTVDSEGRGTVTSLVTPVPTGISGHEIRKVMLGTRAEENAEVNLTPRGLNGCTLQNIEIVYTIDDQEQRITLENGLTKEENGTYTFTMPNADVTVEATFVQNTLIVESNLAGKATVNVDETIGTIYVYPSTGYQVKQIRMEDGAHTEIGYTKGVDGPNTYQVDLANKGMPVHAYIEFEKITDKAVIDNSNNNLKDETDVLSNQVEELSGTMEQINKIVDGRNIDDLSPEEREALNTQLSELGKEMSETGRTLSQVIRDLNATSEVSDYYVQMAIRNAEVEMERLTADMEVAFRYLQSGFDKLRTTLVYLNGKYDVQFVSLSDTMNNSLNALFDRMDLISEYAGQMNTHLSQDSDVMEADLHTINDQVNTIFNLIADKIEDIEDRYYDESGYQDISEQEIDLSMEGRVDLCTNEGVICGDVNVGGIAGSMAIDEEDPEGNAAGTSNKSLGSRYLTKCIASKCVNRGEVTSKKDGVGGTVGYMNLGIIKGCENYGNIASTEGEYAGGIAGQATALIQSCYAMSDLNASQYVGGIAGLGSRIEHCYSMVTIDEECIKKGAIAGFVDKKEDERDQVGEDIKENYFVSQSLGGIDEVSYIGVAEPIPYKDLLEQPGVPNEFQNLTVRFIADGKIIDVRKVKYGQALDTLKMPETPDLGDTYSIWPDLEGKIVEGNLTLEAEMADKIATLSTEGFMTVTLEDGSVEKKVCAYADGNFDGECKLYVNVLEQNDTRTMYEINIENCELPPTEETMLRLYNPYKKILVKRRVDDETWENIEYKDYGQYIQVPLEGTHGYFAIEKKSNKIPCIIAGTVGGVGVLIGVTLGIRKIAQKKKLKKKKK